MYSLILHGQIERDLMRQWEIAHQRASIVALQMRPHFIRNTLMTIYSLCNQDPQKARQVTMDFTDCLRKNFKAVASEDPRAGGKLEIKPRDGGGTVVTVTIPDSAVKKSCANLETPLTMADKKL